MRRNPWAAALAAVLFTAALAVGGYFIYQAGYQNGLAETATEVVVQSRPFYPGFGIFFGFIFLFFLFGIVGRLFWWRGWRGPRYEMWAGEHDRPPMERRLNDWHDRAHSADAADRGDAGDTRRE